MDTILINDVNNWSYWDKNLKEGLKNAALNENIGDKIVFENEEFKVWTIHLEPGKRLPFHIHKKRYFWSALSAGKARSYHNDGSVKETSYEIGDTQYYSDLNSSKFFIHDLKNIGDTELIFSTVEFKK